LSSSTKSPTHTNTLSPSSPSTPTSLPEGVFTGTGNQKIDIDAWSNPIIISFAHSGTGAFKTISLDLLGEPLALLVDITGTYAGRQIINAGNIQLGAIEIQTEGDWKVELEPLANAIPLELPVTINGENSEVFRLDRMIYQLSVNADNSNGWINVIGYGENDYVHIILNEQAPISKMITVKDPEILSLEIITLGNWEIDLK